MSKMWKVVLVLGGLVLAGSASAAPDLVVTNIELIPVGAVPGTGTIRAHVQNIGPDDVVLPFLQRTDLAFSLDGSACDQRTVADLAAGQSATVDSVSCNAATAGSHAVSITIDSDMEVAESNELNNTRVDSLTWLAQPTVPMLGAWSAALMACALSATGVLRARGQLRRRTSA